MQNQTTPATLFTLKQGAKVYGRSTSTADLVQQAESRLQACPGSTATFAIWSPADKLVAALSTERITGVFYKQVWGGRKGDDAVTVGEEHFDATDHILNMAPDAVRSLEDCDDETDEVGRSHVSWDGPCSVHVVTSLCDFFGVEDVEDITDEALAFAKQRLNPQPATEQTLTLSIQVKISVAPGANVSEFIENLDYSVTSNTHGITVRDTEIVDSD